MSKTTILVSCDEDDYNGWYCNFTPTCPTSGTLANGRVVECVDEFYLQTGVCDGLDFETAVCGAGGSPVRKTRGGGGTRG